jgi:hypothetical protein
MGAAIGAFAGAALGLIIARMIAGSGIWVYIGIALESPSG